MNELKSDLAKSMELTSGKIISVFGSGTIQHQEKEYQFALALGEELARQGYVVCCGGYGGAMSAVAQGARKRGGETIGVTIKSFGKANSWITHEITTESLFERLQHLLNLPMAYIVLKGSTGTLVELSLAWELLNKQIISPPRPLIIAHSSWLQLIGEFIKLLDTPPPANPHFPFPTPPYFYYADSIGGIMEILSGLGG